MVNFERFFLIVPRKVHHHLEKQERRTQYHDQKNVGYWVDSAPGRLENDSLLFPEYE
jgi:hypothetical protein